MAEALAGTGKPFVGVSGTLALALGGLEGTGTEENAARAVPQADGENAVISLADRGVRSSVVRLPPTVHSSLDHRGYIPALIEIAPSQRQGGVRRRRVEPVARGAHAGRSAPAPAGDRVSAGRVAGAYCESVLS